MRWLGRRLTCIGNWGQGFWSLLEFAMQMCLIMMTGYILACSPPVRKLMDGLSGLSNPENPYQAIVVMSLFSMILACILALLWQGAIPISTVTLKLYSGIDTFPFLAIPLFILAGGFMEQGGISQRLVQFAKNLVGHIRGGLGFVVIVAEIFFSGISETMASVVATATRSR